MRWVALVVTGRLIGELGTRPSIRDMNLIEEAIVVRGS